MPEAPRPSLPFRIAGNGDGVLVPVRVRPGAHRDRIEGIVTDTDGTRRLKLTVTAAAEGGKANKAVVALLAKTWKFPKTAISIASGRRGRSKTVRISGAPPSILAALAQAGDDSE